MLHLSIVCDRKNEVCCCSLMFQKKLSSETNFSDGTEEYFDELKKPLIQYYYVYRYFVDRYLVEIFVEKGV